MPYANRKNGFRENDLDIHLPHSIPQPKDTEERKEIELSLEQVIQISTQKQNCDAEDAEIRAPKEPSAQLMPNRFFLGNPLCREALRIVLAFGKLVRTTGLPKHIKRLNWTCVSDNIADLLQLEILGISLIKR